MLPFWYHFSIFAHADYFFENAKGILDERTKNRTSVKGLEYGNGEW